MMYWRIYIDNEPIQAWDLDFELDIEPYPGFFDLGAGAGFNVDNDLMSGTLSIYGGSDVGDLLYSAWENPTFLHIEAVAEDGTIWPVVDLEDVALISIGVSVNDTWFGDTEFIYSVDFMGHEIS